MSQYAAQTAPSSPRIATPRLLPQAPRPWWSNTFRALRHRNYRLYFFGQLVSLVGSWVQTTALTWLAYRLTGGSWWPALVGTAQVLPTFLLGGWGGTLADRWPKRPLIFVCQALFLVLALLLAFQVVFGQATPWHLLAIAAACGLVNAVDLPARLAFVMEMVGREDLVNAVGLNSLLFNGARAAGPALGALILYQLSDPGHPYLGSAVCFLLNAVSFVAVLIALACMRFPEAAARAPVCRKGGALMSGFRYLADQRKLVLLLLLSAAMTLFGWPVLSLLPALADKNLHVGEGGYSAMLSGIGAGAFVAALVVASFGSPSRQRYFLGTGVVLAAASLACLSLVRSLPPATFCCALLGGGLILFFPTAQSVMQLGARDNNRGRIMGIWSMILSGAHPVGQLLSGRAADLWGVSLVLAFQALGITVAAALVLFLARGKRMVRFKAGPPPGLIAPLEG
jgi:MFS family permease